MHSIRRLCSFEGRYPGTDAERRAANHLAAELESSGRRVEIEPTYVHPHWHLVHAAHLALGVAAGLISLESPAVGFALALVTATSLYLDLNTRLYLLRRLFFRRASQNVLSRGGNPSAAGRVILCAHYDAGRTGWIYGKRGTRLTSRVPARLRVALGPMRIVFWTIALLVPLLGARLAGLDERWLGGIQLVLTGILIVAFVLLVDIALSDVVPGAGDNASGVAVAMALAGTLEDEAPAHLDVWVLLTGGQECTSEGMRGFLKRHRRELSRENTYVVAIDTVGHGELHHVSSEGLAVSFPMDPRLLAISEAIALADREGADRYAAEAVATPFLTDAMPARLAGYPAIAITCLSPLGLPPETSHTHEDTPERIDPDALASAHDFALELVRQVDRDLGRQTARPVLSEA